jgi:nitrogen fixation NifU-like protein
MDEVSKSFAQKVEGAMHHPRNLGELEGADAVGTVGSGECGDMLRMWVKFREEGGRRVIDRATFQTFGCETAIAVASLATELITGKTAEEALALSGEEIAAPLGPLPPVNIHCAQLVEGALRSALSGVDEPATGTPKQGLAPTLLQQFQGTTLKKIVLKKDA